MEFRMLGALEAVEDGRALELGGAKQRALLAVLLLERNRTVPADRLVDALWGEEPTETARKALQVYVSQLRKLLGRERVETRPPGYLLRVEPDELDLVRFERLRQEGRFRDALALWRGPPLAEFASQQFAQAEIARLEELRLACLEERVERDLAVGRHAELVGELEGLVTDHPLRERLRAQLMLALYRSGRQAEALQAYQDARQAMVEGLGIEPGKALRDVHQAILRQEAELDVEAVMREPRLEAPRSVFVGRDSELAECLQALDESRAGRGRLLLIAGEPGIGKSRLLDELVSRAALAARVLAGRCWEAGGAPPYWPWAQALREYVRRCEARALKAQLGSGASDVAQIVPDVRRILSDVGDCAAPDSDSARFRLFESVAAFLERASQARPLVLCFDDLHAADAPSLLLLQFVAGELERMHVLVAGAYRDLDPAVSDQLASTLADVSRHETTRRIALGGLSEGEVGRLVALSGGAGASESVSAVLHASTEGNPLFVVELIRLLAAEGRLEGQSPRLAVPDSIREVIGRRLRHLSSECRRVLTLASIIGREFGLVALERVADYTGIDRLLEVLDEAIAARVVMEVPGSLGRLRFGHALIRETLYVDVVATQRVRLHRRVAEVLEELYRADPEPHLSELAHHYVAGVPAIKAARAAAVARRAGDRALLVLAYEEAARLYRDALEAADLADPPDERVRCELLLAVGEAEMRAGERTSAKQAFLGAADIARRLGLRRELALAAVAFGGRIVWARAGDDHRLVPLLEEGLAAVADSEYELRARLLARLAGALRDEPTRERRDALSRDAVQLARRAASDAALAYALDARIAAVIAPDTLSECLALADELLELAERRSDRERLVAAHLWRVAALLMLSDVPAAESDLERADELATELRQPDRLWEVAGVRAMLALAAGRLAEAEKLSSRALALGEDVQPDGAIPIFRCQAYALSDFRGALDGVEPALRELVARYPARPVFRCLVALVDARLGRTDEAMRALQDIARDDFSGLPFDQEWLYATSLVAEASALLRDTQSADALYRLLLPWSAMNAVDHAEGIRGSVSRYLGLLATATGRHEDAEAHFQAAIPANERMGARPWLARTRTDYARMLRARDRPGDVALAERLDAAARADYAELGIREQPPAREPP